MVGGEGEREGRAGTDANAGSLITFRLTEWAKCVPVRDCETFGRSYGFVCALRLEPLFRVIETGDALRVESMDCVSVDCMSAKGFLTVFTIGSARRETRTSMRGAWSR